MQLQEQILKEFGFLFENDEFVFLNKDAEYPEMIIIAQSDSIKFRFTKDRADFFLDVAANTSDEWTSFYTILNQLKQKGLIADDYKYSNKIEANKRLLKKHFHLVKDFL